MCMSFHKDLQELWTLLFKALPTYCIALYLHHFFFPQHRLKNQLSQHRIDALHRTQRLKSQPLEGESCRLSPSENFVTMKWQLWQYLPKGRARAQSKALNIRKQLKECTLKPQNSFMNVLNLMGPQLCWLFWQPQTWGAVGLTPCCHTKQETSRNS